MVHRKWTDVNDMGNDTKTVIYQEKILDTAFINNTTWIAKSFEDLRSMLEIAHSFFKLNDILINNDKSVLLTNNRQYSNKPVTFLTMSVGSITIKSELTCKATRVLGV